MKNTRERILNAAFETLFDSQFTGITLAEVAKRAGITKPAIYRHFPGKKALLNAMKEDFFDVFSGLVALLERLSPPDGTGNPHDSPLFVLECVRFFSQRPDYMNFFVWSVLESDEFEKELTDAMKKRGVVPAGFVHCSGSPFVTGDINKYLSTVFASVTIVNSIIEMRRVTQEDGAPVPADFPEKVCDFILNGWDALSPLTPERFAELELVCRIPPEEIPEEPRIMLAVASVVDQYGFPGATVERIAAALDMAKSRLYSWFKNKNEMLANLIFDEIKQLVSILEVREKQARNLSESVFVRMRTFVSYLIARPSLIPVFSWLRSSGINADMKLDKRLYTLFPVSGLSGYPEFKLPDMGIPFTNDFVVRWVCIIPVSILIQCRLHNFTDEQISESFRTVFGFMEGGIGSFVHE